MKGCPHNGEVEGQYLPHGYPLVQVDFSQVRRVRSMSIGNPQTVEERLGLWPGGPVRGSDVASTPASHRLQVSACGSSTYPDLSRDAACAQITPEVQTSAVTLVQSGRVGSAYAIFPGKAEIVHPDRQQVNPPGVRDWLGLKMGRSHRQYRARFPMRPAGACYMLVMRSIRKRVEDRQHDTRLAPL